MDLEDIKDNDPLEKKYSPEKREAEHRYVKEMIEAINTLNIPLEKKNITKKFWNDYLSIYEQEYALYHNEKEKIFSARRYMLLKNMSFHPFINSN